MTLLPGQEIAQRALATLDAFEGDARRRLGPHYEALDYVVSALRASIEAHGGLAVAPATPVDAEGEGPTDGDDALDALDEVEGLETVDELLKPPGEWLDLLEDLLEAVLLAQGRR